MSEAVSVDMPTLQENNQTGRRSSHEHPTSELRHDFGSKTVCTEPMKQKHDTTNNVQTGSAEARTTQSDSFGIEQLRCPEDMTENSSYELLRPPSADATTNSSLNQMGILAESLTRKSSSPKQTTAELNNEFGSECADSEPLEQKLVIAAEIVEEGPAETGTTGSDFIGVVPVEMSPEDVTRDSSWEQTRPLSEDLTMKSTQEELVLPPEEVTVNSNPEHLEPLLDVVPKNPSLTQIGLMQEDETKNPSQSGRKANGMSVRWRRGKHMLSAVGSTRVLRSRLQEKAGAPGASNNVAEDSANREKRRKKRKNRTTKISTNELSRIRTHLRYLLHRMKYEQNLIDAYSGEGWKGQSLEKIKPEKELQRAKSEIFRCKSKIRDLFQRLDLSCAEGTLPDSLFDSEGLIDSEDIFCAKCGSKDLAADNDIILCDGACERGFHQFCLEPPLLKEDIPPGDEGWLCPGCDCKVDCIDLLNDSQGTNLSIIDKWEKVFPEAAAAAAAAAAGNKLDDGFGLPSDDSEDDDYIPDVPEMDENIHGDESSSDDSDYYSASDDFGASLNEEYLGLPSDDLDDDDYDPNALDLDEQVKQESSSSDFTSDSEDFNAAFEDNRSLVKDQGCKSSLSDHETPCTGSDGERSKLSGGNSQSLRDELLHLLESDAAPVSGKRHVERLDYKKLLEETYGNVSSDSSDEDYLDNAAPKRRKNNSGKVASVSPNGMTPVVKYEAGAKNMNYNEIESERTPKRRGRRKKLDVAGINNSSAKSNKSSSEPGSSGKITAKSANRRLGEAVTQRLFESFKENHYPERAVKENLAKELGLEVKQVSKWFENARWSFHHSSRTESSIAENSLKKGTPASQVNEKTSGLEPKMVRTAACNGVENKELPKVSPEVVEYCGGDVMVGNLATEEVSRQKCTPKCGRRKNNLDHLASDHISNIEGTPEQSVQDDSPKAQQLRKSSRIQTRSRNSIA